MYFYGSFEHSVDERGRIAVPAKFRRALQDGGVLRGGPDGCVELYSQDGFAQEVQLRLGEESGTGRRSARRTRRGFLAGAYEVELDRQGRVLIPQPVREHGDLNGRVTFVGCGDYIEIWTPERWTAESALISARSEEEDA